MEYAAVLYQKTYRGYALRKFLREEELRKLDGPRVTEVYKRGTVVSKIPLMLSVFRCGMSGCRLCSVCVRS